MWFFINMKKFFQIVFVFYFLISCKSDSNVIESTKENTQPKKIEAVTDVDEEIISSNSVPPKEKGNFKKTNLVELIHLDPTLKLDIRYATKNNFLGKRVYKQARAFLQKDAAYQLINAHKELKKLGFGILVYDGYRPWSVTKVFWDLTPSNKKNFVANPKKGSKHNRGCAVDISLFNLQTGNPVIMPSDFDAFGKSAYSNFKGGTKQSRTMRDLLISKMTLFGFQVEKNEWWHFNYKDWRSYKIENIPFEKL